MIFEPEFGFVPGETHLIDERPEVGAVIMMFQMRKLVQDDVILHKRRRHDETPVQHDPTCRTAASPAGNRIAHGECPGSKAGASGEFQQALAQMFIGQCLKKITNPARKKIGVATDVQCVIRIDPDTPSFLRCVADGVWHAIDGDEAAGGEADGCWSLLQLPDDPVVMSVEKRQAGLWWDTRRQCDDYAVACA